VPLFPGALVVCAAVVVETVVVVCDGVVALRPGVVPVWPGEEPDLPPVALAPEWPGPRALTGVAAGGALGPDVTGW